MSDVVIYSSGIIYCSVCAVADMDDGLVEAYVNLRNPSGTSNGWSLAKEDFADGSPNPCPCDDEPDTRKHYLFSC